MCVLSCMQILVLNDTGYSGTEQHKVSVEEILFPHANLQLQTQLGEILLHLLPPKIVYG